jgi:N-glycosylase/DNA lyase
MHSDLHKYQELKNSLINNEQINWVVDYKTISKERYAQEFVFCLMTPQSKALAAKAVLDEVGGDISRISAEILGRNGVRFKNIKIENIRAFFYKASMYDIFVSDQPNNVVRNILYKETKGFGLKEASHFCRNAGRGDDIAIIDRHILNCYINRWVEKWEGYELLSPAFQYCNGIFNKDIALTEDRYFLIEDCIVKYAKDLNIPSKYLDMIWWSEKSGHMFK